MNKQLMCELMSVNSKNLNIKKTKKNNFVTFLNFNEKKVIQ